MKTETISLSLVFLALLSILIIVLYSLAKKNFILH